jgi:putative nucleotidyltransferase with HDIG domain
MSEPRIVIIDDNVTNLLLMKALAQAATGVVARTFDDPLPALAACQAEGADLIVVDFMMPHMDGLEFIRQVRSSELCADVPIVMVTAAGQAELRRQALEAGATDFLSKPLDATEMKLRTRNLLALRMARNQLRDRAAQLADEVRQATAALRDGERELVARLCRAAEFRDPETGGHINRMARYSQLIARRLGLDAGTQEQLLVAAPLHDIGKIATPDHILLKPGRLTDEEMVVMRQHAEVGARILADSKMPEIRMGCDIAAGHHERWDGAGYPRGLAGEAIPLVARIVAVADVFDALTSVRPYKAAWPLLRAREHIAAGIGSHFDPRCAQTFLDAWDEVLAIRAAHPD